MFALNRILYAAAVVLVVAVLGLELASTSPGAGGASGDDELSSRMQAWSDARIVLHGITIAGVTRERLRALAETLEARPDTVSATWDLQSPEWSGDPELAEEWNTLWRERAVGTIEARPDWRVVERTSDAVETWRRGILSHSVLSDATVSADPLMPLSMALGYEAWTDSRFARLWLFILCGSLMAWGISLANRVGASSKWSMHARPRANVGWLAQWGLEFLGAVLVVFVVRGVFFGGEGSPIEVRFSASGRLFFLGAYALVFVFDVLARIAREPPAVETGGHEAVPADEGDWEP